MEFFNSLLEKCTGTLKLLIYVTTEADGFIELLNTRELEGLEVRNLSPKVQERLSMMSKLNRLKVWYVETDQEVMMAVNLLHRLKTLK